MLDIHVLNVEHGDSIVLDLKTENQRAFGVIDSNCRANTKPKALALLEKLGAERLSFVALTHPHKDHYRGLLEILKAFHGRIDKFYLFNIGDIGPKRVKQLAKPYLDAAARQDDAEITQIAAEFVGIIKYIYENMQNDIVLLGGESLELFPPRFDGPKIFSILPPLKAKGAYFQRLTTGDPAICENIADNEMSSAFRILYGKSDIVLGGDGTIANWRNHRRAVHFRDDYINADVVKLPHHGSEHDCSDEVLNYLFAGSGQRVAAISANGQTHPSPDVIKNLERRGIHPYCTNLIPTCGAKVTELVSKGGVDPELAKWVQQLADPHYRIQPCQGDLTISIHPESGVTVTREFLHPCGFRGDFSSLFSLPTP